MGFKISDLNISGKPIPEDVADKIQEYHIPALNNIQDNSVFKISVSKKSGYRSKKWEWVRGRSGNSQHCFKGKGAVDVTCEDFIRNKDELLKAIIKYTDYTRIAVYSSFIHLDYAHSNNDRWVFNSRWQRLYSVV